MVAGKHRWRYLSSFLAIVALVQAFRQAANQKLLPVRPQGERELSVAPYGATWWPRHRGAGSDRDYDAHAGYMDGGNGTRASGTAGGDAGTLRTAMEIGRKFPVHSLERSMGEVLLCLIADQCPCCIEADGFPKNMRYIAPDHLKCDGCQFERWVIVPQEKAE